MSAPFFFCSRLSFFTWHAPSGTTGSLFKDFTWGTELYPRVFGVDIKRFINCRFSMTFWMLAGLVRWGGLCVCAAWGSAPAHHDLSLPT